MKRAIVLGCIVVLLLSGCGLVEDVPPVADAGKDQTLKLGATVALDASKSREIDGGRIVEYRWMIIGVPRGKESDVNRVVATVAAAQTTIELPADDGALSRLPAPVPVTGVPLLAGAEAAGAGRCGQEILRMLVHSPSFT